MSEAAGGAGEPIDPVHEQQVEPSRLRLPQRLAQARAVQRRAGLLIGVFAGERPAVLAGDIGGEAFGLGFQRVGLVGFVGGDAGVGGDPHGVSFRAVSPSMEPTCAGEVKSSTVASASRVWWAA